MDTKTRPSLSTLASGQRWVAVIGAGPAGIFAARELAANGVQVCLFNRDIKPGGLAEYGIYPDKIKLRDGLHAQFYNVLHSPGVLYFGNVLIRRGGDLSLDDLRNLGFQAILVAAGAQGTKWLGLPGETLAGIHHAKDIVYHYNHLPPFSQRKYPIGKRVGVIGMGNVMADITHYLTSLSQVEEVIVLARRGPLEAKFDRHELETIVSYINPSDLQAELERVQGILLAAGQDVTPFVQSIQAAREKTAPAASHTRLTFRFLTSPQRFIGDDQNHLQSVEVEDNRLEVINGDTKARGTGIISQLELDTLIFAIGDTVDGDLGLPVERGEFIKCPNPRFPIEGTSYEACDPSHPASVEDIFLAGWSRKTSSGLVGLARRDGVNAARAILGYLAGKESSASPSLEEVTAALQRCGKPILTQSALDHLEEIERARAAELGVEVFKFDGDQEMLEAAGLFPISVGG